MTSAGVVEAKDTYRGSFDNSATTSLHGACAFRKLLPPGLTLPNRQQPSRLLPPTLHSPTSCCCCCAVRSMGCFCKKKVLQAAYYIQTAEQWREGSLLTPQGIHSFLLLVSCNNSLDGTTKWLIWLRVYVSMFLPKRIIFLSTSIPLQVRIRGR